MTMTSIEDDEGELKKKLKILGECECHPMHNLFVCVCGQEERGEHEKGASKHLINLLKRRNREFVHCTLSMDTFTQLYMYWIRSTFVPTNILVLFQSNALSFQRSYGVQFCFYFYLFLYLYICIFDLFYYMVFFFLPQFSTLFYISAWIFYSIHTEKITDC